MLYDVEVAVVGLGLMGSSLAAAMRRRMLVRRIVGIARRPEAARRALDLGAGDETTTDLNRAATSDVVVLAVPVGAILTLLPEVARRMMPGALLTDVGSTKEQIVRAAAGLPVAFLGGHPMAGSERSGVEACDADLYKGFPWILVRQTRATARQCELMDNLAAGVGARPVWLATAEEHDRAIAAVSHAPYLLAYALLGATPEAARGLAGSSFRDATRVAQGPAEMVLDFLLTNRHVPEAARALIARLEELVGDLERGDRARWEERIRALRRG